MRCTRSPSTTTSSRRLSGAASFLIASSANRTTTRRRRGTYARFCWAPWPTATRTVSLTATSSRRTCCFSRTGTTRTSSSPISASPRRSAPMRASPHSAEPQAMSPQRSLRGSSTALSPTCGPLVSLSTSFSEATPPSSRRTNATSSARSARGSSSSTSSTGDRSRRGRRISSRPSSRSIPRNAYRRRRPCRIRGSRGVMPPSRARIWGRTWKR
mmetsp:Transcript_29921/g.88968  ORF Transcript_29921/g.88968 Transcript_29921/m.88968 type:complete len:214 (-) Transcript_29921:1227-1868(-)